MANSVELNLTSADNKADVFDTVQEYLGNLSLNTGNFCKEFNSLTNNLPSYLWIKVYLKVNTNSRT